LQGRNQLYESIYEAHCGGSLYYRVLAKTHTRPDPFVVIPKKVTKVVKKRDHRQHPRRI